MPEKCPTCKLFGHACRSQIPTETKLKKVGPIAMESLSGNRPDDSKKEDPVTEGSDVSETDMEEESSSEDGHIGEQGLNYQQHV